MMVGIVDADLLASGTRHPNLALLKIAGFLHDNGVKFELIFKPDVNLKKYAVVFMSRVFTFTPEPDFYTQVARWVNQPAFYKKQSFWQYCYRNQSLWEQKHLPELHRPDLKTFDEFMADVAAGFYETTAQMCQPLRTVLDMLAMFPERRDELLDMFNTRMPPPQ